MNFRNYIKLLIIAPFLSACEGPAVDGVLTHTIKDENRAIVLEHILKNRGLEFKLDGTTFTYQVDDWKEYAQAEEDSFGAKKMVIKNVEDKQHFKSVFQKNDIRFIEIEQDSDSLFLWWAVDDNQQEYIALKLAENDLLMFPKLEYEVYKHEPFNNLQFEIVRGWSMIRDRDQFVFSSIGKYPALKLQTVGKTPQYSNVKEFLEFQLSEDGIDDPYDIRFTKVKGYEAVQYYWDNNDPTLPLKNYFLALDLGEGILMYNLVSDKRYFDNDSIIMENIKKSLVFIP